MPGPSPAPAPAPTPVIADLDAYKTETKQLIDLVVSERDLVRTIPSVNLTTALLEVDAWTAKGDVESASSDFQVSAIRGTYEGYLREIRNQIKPLTNSSITTFETELSKYGTLKIYFSSDILEAAAGIAADKTTLESDPTAAISVGILDKYTTLTQQLAIQSAASNGVMFKTAKQAALDRIVNYVQQVRRIEPLGGGALLSATGTLAQVSAQADFDRRKLNETTVAEIIELYNDTYATKNATLIAKLREYGGTLLDGFTESYKVVTDPEAPLSDYIAPSMSNAFTELPTKRQIITDSLSFEELASVIETYVGNAESLPLEIQRARSKKALTEVKTLLTDISGFATGIVLSAEIPSITMVNQTLTRLPSIRAESILKQVADQYVTILASIKTQFATFTTKALTDFSAYWKTVKAFSRIMPTTVINAAASVEADATAMASLAPAEMATTSNKYVSALKQAKDAVAASETAIKLLTKQNAVQAAITTFSDTVTTATTMSLVVDASGVTTDSAAIFAPSVSTATLDSLQKKYVALTTTAVSKISKALADMIKAFSSAVLSAQAKKATLPTNVRLAFTTLNADMLKLAGGVMTVLEMQEMYQKYAQLTAAVTAALPATGSIDTAKSELQQMIQIFSSLISSPAAVGIQFSQLVTGTNTAADTTAVAGATDLNTLLAIRTRYVQMLYELNTKLEAAKTAAATAIAEKVQAATTAITDFEVQLAAMRTPPRAFDLAPYPQVLEAERNLTANKAVLTQAAVTLDAAETVRATYADATATLKYIIAAGTATDRASKYQAALLSMSRFTNIYQANMAVSASFSQPLRTAALQIPAEVTWIQDTSRILADFDTTIAKYNTLTSNILNELVVIKQDSVASTLAAIRQFQTAYGALTSDQIAALSAAGMNFDVRLMEMDLATVGSPGASLDIITQMAEKYAGYSRGIATVIPNLPQRQLATPAAKEEVMRIMRQLNSLFVENRAIYGSLSSGLQARIQQMGAKIRYVGGTNVGAAEVKGLLDDYTAALNEFKDVLFQRPVTPTTLDASLQSVITEFQTAYNAADIYALDKTNFNYIQALLRNTANAYVTQNVPEAIRAFTRGIEILSKVPRVTEQRVLNTEYNTLLETVNYFLSEWTIRNLGRAIPNDRLFLTGLKTNAPSLLATYKVRAPNIRNYDLIVKGLVDEYKQGLQVLRTYPMKS